MKSSFNSNDLLLFTGDSITDGDRRRNDPDSLGEGYVQLIAARLAAAHPELNLRFRNTGISGDRTCDLLSRWDDACINLKPDWVSILIGVNNTWRRYDNDDLTSLEVFESEYRDLLKRITNETNAKIIVCSPFLVHTDASIERMREDLDPKIGIIKQLAGEFNAIWVDFDAAFISGQTRHMPSYWAGDGVHPSVAGHALMADTWLGIVGG